MGDFQWGNDFGFHSVFFPRKNSRLYDKLDVL